jgi:hypothetical protein
MPSRVELLQGTLDMLILKTLHWALNMAMESARQSVPNPLAFSRSRQDRFTPHFTGWKDRDG